MAAFLHLATSKVRYDISEGSWQHDYCVESDEWRPATEQEVAAALGRYVPPPEPVADAEPAAKPSRRKAD